MKDLDGATAFVTGGAQGIGLGIARSLAKRGVKLALADIDEAALAAAEVELGGTTTVATYRLDLRDRDAFADVADRIERSLGQVTLLFNNAGVASGVPVRQMSYEKWDWLLAINLGGVINGIQTFVPRMIEAGKGGYLVNTASGAGLAASGSGFLYTTSKFAVVGLSEALRPELEPYEIGVSVLCPGPVNTGIVRNSAQQEAGGTELPPEVASRLEAVSSFLALGAAIEEVGEMVLAGMAAGHMHIHTDDIMRQAVIARNQSILETMPGETA